MNKFKEKLTTILVGDYILDEMTKDERIEVTPNYWREIRNKYLQYKINKLKDLVFQNKYGKVEKKE